MSATVCSAADVSAMEANMSVRDAVVKASEGNLSVQKGDMEMNVFEKINGKKLDVFYETGAHYKMTYLSEKELRWDALGEIAEGEAPFGTEPYWAYYIAPGIYNVNWIEADGMTASQILDFNTNKVYAFLTWADESSRGGRDQILQKGVFELVE